MKIFRPLQSVRPVLVSVVGLILAVGLTQTLSACTPREEEAILVVVNGRQITQSEFDYRWAELADATKARYEKHGGKRKFLDEMITYELLLQEARRQGIDQSESIRERAQRFKEQLILDELLKDKIKARVELSKEELDAYYAVHARELLAPLKAQVSIMLLPNIFAAKDLKKQVETGGDFAKFAQRYSIDEKTKVKGGDLGPYRKGIAPPDVEDVIPTLKTGQVSEPIKTEAGYYIVRLSPLDKETLEADVATRERLRQELLAEKRRKRLEDVVSSLRSKATIRLADASRYVMEDTGRPSTTLAR